MTRELTNSARAKFYDCPRAYSIAYVQRVRPVAPSTALAFGTAFHAFLEEYWKSVGGTVPDPASFDFTKDSKDKVLDGYTAATLRALASGYIQTWGESDAANFEPIGAEIRYDAPLMNPETGAPSRTWHLSGKIDALAREKATGKVFVIEHKTAGVDISPGANYWLKLAIDGQVSGYYIGAQSLGYDAQDCVYDVIRKPTIEPLKATPEDKRKYTKEGKLYANQREFDETPEEWEERLLMDIAANPSKYYARNNVARSDNDLADYLFDMWAVGKNIADAERLGRFPRNAAACSRYGTCEYFGVCAGFQSLTDPVLFKVEESANPELANKNKE